MTDLSPTSSAQAQEPSSNDDSGSIIPAHHHHRHHHHYPQPQIIYVLANPQDFPPNAYPQGWPLPSPVSAAVMPQVTAAVPPPPPAAATHIPQQINGPQNPVCTTIVDDCCADCCPVAASETNGEQQLNTVQTPTLPCCSPSIESQRMATVPYAIRPPNLHHFQSLRPIAPYAMASVAPSSNPNPVSSAISHLHGQHNIFTNHTPKLSTPQTQHGQPQRHSHSVSTPTSPPSSANYEQSNSPSAEASQVSQRGKHVDGYTSSQAATQNKATAGNNDASNSDSGAVNADCDDSTIAESSESSLTALSEAAVAAASKERTEIAGHKRKLDEQQGEARCLWAACAAVFKCIDDVIPHLTKLHVGSRSIKASNQCRWEECKTEKEDTDELISHVCQDHLGTTELKHGCHWSGCETRFDTFDDLTDHLSERHIGTGKSQYVCSWEECERQGRAFNQRQKVMRHIQTHTGMEKTNLSQYILYFFILNFSFLQYRRQTISMQCLQQTVF